MTDPTIEPALTTLLQRHRPMVRYDSLESFYADSAAIITDSPGNVLKRRDGTVLASATGPGPKLSLNFLGPRQYANGSAVASSDSIEEAGPDYVASAREMHLRPGYADMVHGRVAIDATGARWLQYWLFMYYDDPGFLGFGIHEGDLEMIQLRLAANDEPDVASYSQHKSGLQAAFSQLELAATPDGPVPVTYSARGSHANLLRPGIQISRRSLLPDHNDGRGHQVRPDLILLSATQAPWSLWPGNWGGTRASGELGQLGIAADSPGGPVRHLAWNQPAAFHASCEPADCLPPAGQPTGPDLPRPVTPELRVVRSAASTTVRYRVPPGDAVPPATKLVAGLVSTGVARPAIVASTDLSGPSGTLELPAPPPDARYELRATTHAEDGTASATGAATLKT